MIKFSDQFPTVFNMQAKDFLKVLFQTKLKTVVTSMKCKTESSSCCTMTAHMRAYEIKRCTRQLQQIVPNLNLCLYVLVQREWCTSLKNGRVASQRIYNLIWAWKSETRQQGLKKEQQGLWLHTVLQAYDKRKWKKYLWCQKDWRIQKKCCFFWRYYIILYYIIFATSCLMQVQEDTKYTIWLGQKLAKASKMFKDEGLT